MTTEQAQLQLTGGAWHEIDIEIERIQLAMGNTDPIYAAKHIISQLHTKLMVAEIQRDEWRKLWQEEREAILQQTLDRIAVLSPRISPLDDEGANTEETEQPLTVNK